jgi:hypothetical protein
MHENLDRIMDEISLPWKELMLTKPVKDVSFERGLLPDNLGVSIKYATRGNIWWDVRYSYRHDKPWSVTTGENRAHHTYRYKTLRYKTLDGLIARLVKEPV